MTAELTRVRADSADFPFERRRDVETLPRGGESSAVAFFCHTRSRDVSNRVMSTVNPLDDDDRNDAEDRALVARTRAGDRDALEALVRRHQA